MHFMDLAMRQVSPVFFPPLFLFDSVSDHLRFILLREITDWNKKLSSLIPTLLT